MSTLNLENIKHPDSASNNISVDSSGNTAVNGSVTATGNVTTNNNLGISAASDGGSYRTLDFTVGSNSGRIVFTGDSFADANYGQGDLTIQTQSSGGQIRFGTGAAGTNMMKIDSAGRVTMPYQPAFYAYASNSYSSTTTNELVAFNGTTFNIGNHFDISSGNHKFVAPVSGVYSFQSTVNTYSVGVGSVLRTDLYVNGSAVSRGDYMISDHTGDQNVSIAVTRYLSANDYVQIYHISDDTSRGFSGGGSWVWFSGYLVG